MARSRMVHPQIRSQLVRRKTDWAFSMQTSSTVSVATAIKVLLISSGGLFLEPFTIIRTRGYFAVASDQQAATEDQIGCFGVGIVSSVARSQGAASILGPFTDPLWDGWFVYGAFGQRLTVGTNVGLEPNYATRYEIDSKAMRKVDGADEDVVLMVENASADGFRVSFHLRFLIKIA